MKTKTAVLISAVIHCAAFFLITLGSDDGNGTHKNGSPDAGMKGVNAKVIPKEVDVEIIEKKTPDSDIKTKKKQPPKKISKDCPGDWYGGVGVMLNLTANGLTIIEIYRGYAADLAGLQVGDMILGMSDPELLGPPGTTIHLTIRRGTHTFGVNVTRTKVCY